MGLYKCGVHGGSQITIPITVVGSGTAYSGNGEYGVNHIDVSGKVTIKNINAISYENTNSSSQTIKYAGTSYTVAAHSTKDLSSLGTGDFELSGGASDYNSGVNKSATKSLSGELTISIS